METIHPLITGIDTKTQAQIDDLKSWDKDFRAKLQEKAIPIKGKDYVLVKDRVLAFNERYTDGSITTEMLSTPDADTVIFKATVTPDGKRFYTGHSQATWDDGNHINKTSALEVAETSAVGRALGMMGIGVLDSIASADEIHKSNGRGKGDVTAIEHESSFLDPEARLPVVRINAIEEACKRNGHSQLAQAKFLGGAKVGQWEHLTNAQFADAIKWASSKPTVPQDLESAAKESLGMVSAAKALANAVIGRCGVCNGEMSPSKQPGGEPYCKSCWKKSKGFAK